MEVWVGDKIEKSFIKLQRTNQFSWAMRQMKILVDNQQISEISCGKKINLTIEPGIHKVFSKIDWSKSREIEIHVKPGEVVELVCGTIGSWYYLINILALLTVFLVLPMFFELPRLLDFHLRLSLLISLVILNVVISFIPSAFINLKKKEENV